MILILLELLNSEKVENRKNRKYILPVRKREKEYE